MVTNDRLLDAIGDPTRRRILARLRSEPQAVGALAAGLPVSRPAVSQHLKVLKEAGLVYEHGRAGTRRIYALDPTGFAALRDHFERFWSDALDNFGRVAEASQREADAEAGRGKHDRR